MGAMEPWRPGSAGLRRLRLGGHLRRDRVPEAEDDRPPDHRAEARPLLAGDDTRPVRLGPLAREPDAALDRACGRQAPQRPAAAHPLAEPANVGPPERRGRRTPGHSHHRRRAAGFPRCAEPRRCLPPLGRRHARLQRTAAWAEVHGLQLRAAAGSGRAGDARGRVPARARPFPRHRPNARRPLRGARPRPARRRSVRGRPLSRALAVRVDVGRGAAVAGRRTNAVRRRRRDRDLAALDRWLRL